MENAKTVEVSFFTQIRVPIILKLTVMDKLLVSNVSHAVKSQTYSSLVMHFPDEVLLFNLLS